MDTGRVLARKHPVIIQGNLTWLSVLGWKAGANEKSVWVVHFPWAVSELVL